MERPIPLISLDTDASTPIVPSLPILTISPEPLSVPTEQTSAAPTIPTVPYISLDTCTTPITTPITSSVRLSRSYVDIRAAQSQLDDNDNEDEIDGAKYDVHAAAAAPSFRPPPVAPVLCVADDSGTVVVPDVVVASPRMKAERILAGPSTMLERPAGLNRANSLRRHSSVPLLAEGKKSSMDDAITITPVPLDSNARSNQGVPSPQPQQGSQSYATASGLSLSARENPSAVVINIAKNMSPEPSTPLQYLDIGAHVDMHNAALYVPRLILRSIASHPVSTPTADRAPAACLHAKIVGFSQTLQRQMSHSPSLSKIGTSSAPQGDAITEALANLFSQFFSMLLAAVSQFEGDVIKITGNSLFAIWQAEDEPDDEDGTTNPDPSPKAFISLSQACRKAAQCAVHLMSLMIGIGAGDVWTRRVGGVNGQWEILIAGHPLLQMNNAAEQAQPGEIVCSWETWNEIQDYCTGKELQSADTKLESVQTELPLIELPHPSTLLAATSDSVPLIMKQLVLGHLSKPIRHIIANLSSTSMSWLSNEARRITLIYANFPELDYMMLEEIEKVQKFTSVILASIQKFEGTLTEFFVNAKGLTFVASFGLPPLSHEDDAVRAVRSALEIREALRRMDWGRLFGKRTSILRSSIVICTGKVFCGTVGSETRKEYTVVGEVMNQAAQVVSMGRDELLADQATYDSTHRSVVYEKVAIKITRAVRADPRVTSLKSYEGAGTPNNQNNITVPYYRPSILDKGVFSRKDKDKSMPFVGRKLETGILGELLKQLKLEGRGHFTLITGSPGIGKTGLLQEFQRMAEESHCKVIKGTGDSILRNAPYHIWESVIVELLDLHSKALSQFTQKPSEPSATLQIPGVPVRKNSKLAPPGALGNQLAVPGDNGSTDRRYRKRMASMLVTHDVFQVQPDLIELAPLLNSIIPNLRMPENALVRDMPTQARAENTRLLLLSLIKLAAERCPFVLLLENGQYMDSASLELLQLAAAQVKSIMFVVTTRPILDSDVGLRDLLRVPDLHVMNLEPLSREDCDKLVAATLQANESADDVNELVYEKSSGNPLFVIEIASSLLNSEKVEVTPTRRAVSKGGRLSVAIGDNLLSLVTGRIDTLANRPSQQYALKVASVVGRSFTFELLSDIYPDEASKATLKADLQALEAAGFIECTAPNTYAFCNQVIREAAYNLLLISQRQQLHKSIGQWYEKMKQDELTPFFPVLALHYELAGLDEQAIYFSEKSAQSALETFAISEAIQYFKKSLQHYQGLGGAVYNSVRCERGLGDAFLRLGNVPQAHTHLSRALSLLGESVPASKNQLYWACVVQRFVLFFRHMFGYSNQAEDETYTVTPMNDHSKALPPMIRSVEPTVEELALEAAFVSEKLVRVSMSSNDTGSSLYFTLRSINIAERLRPNGVVNGLLARNYAHLGLLFSLSGNEQRALEYFSRSSSLCDLAESDSKADVLLIEAHREMMRANWKRAKSLAEEGLKQCSLVGDLRTKEECMLSIAFSLRMSGDTPASTDMVQQYLDSSKARGDMQMEARGMCDLSHVEMLAGKYREAAILVQKARSMLSKTETFLVSDNFALYGRFAVASWRGGDKTAAIQAALSAYSLIAKSDALHYFSFDGYSGMCEVFLALLDSLVLAQKKDAGPIAPSPTPSQADDLSRASTLKMASDAIASFDNFAAKYKFAKPRALLYHFLLQKHTQSGGKDPNSSANAAPSDLRMLNQSLEMAREFEMPYEEGLAMYLIGANGGDSELIRKAEQIFTRIGVARPSSSSDAPSTSK